MASGDQTESGGESQLISLFFFSPKLRGFFFSWFG